MNPDADPHPDAVPDLDPAISVSDLQDFKKKNFLLLTF
jgi:hypothetical protein